MIQLRAQIFVCILNFRFNLQKFGDFLHLFSSHLICLTFCNIAVCHSVILEYSV